MTPAIDEHDVTVLLGDVREQLATLQDGSTHCVVTSPPYYGLRDYGTGGWAGGTNDCDHSLSADEDWTDPKRSSPRVGSPTRSRVDRCRHCGAERVDRQIGRERTPSEYIEGLLAVTDELARVLRPDGTLWLNLGDAYSGKANGGPSFDRHRGHGHAAGVVAAQVNTTRFAPYKSLLGLPWRIALAMTERGWRLRNEIIWNKPNGMPESVGDRLSTRHEQLFMFSRADRYYFDLDAIREPHAPASIARVQPHRSQPGRSYREGTAYGDAAPPQTLRLDQLNHPGGRNPGDVWTIPTARFPGAHFATFPPTLVRRCILAGCPEEGTVLDPFVGSGTTLMVARSLGRRSIGIELNPRYIDIIRERIGQAPLEFGAEAAG